MEILHRRADARNDTRKFQGAIAGATMTDTVRDYTHKAKPQIFGDTKS